MDSLTGYIHPRYASAFSFYGKARSLQHSKGHVIERKFGEHKDAIGIYPLFFCRWNMLSLDLAEMDGLVSFVAVTDPFGNYTRDELFLSGFDVVKPYKEHYIIDLHEPKVSKHHRYYARKALQDDVEVRVGGKLDDWVSLYDNLVKRHHITGLQAFPRESFEKQFKVPGLTVLTAEHDGIPISMHLWYTIGNVAYSHLAASSQKGYELMASYAIHYRAMDYFYDKVRYIDLGAGADAGGHKDDGLVRFKRGWSSMELPVYLIGAILQPDVYKRLCKVGQREDYFPAYR